MSHYVVMRDYPEFRAGPYTGYSIGSSAIDFTGPSDILYFVVIGPTQGVDWKIVGDLPGPGTMYDYNYNWEIDAWQLKPPPAATQTQKNAKIALVNATRDAKIETSFPFMGKLIQTRPNDQINIIALDRLASEAIAVEIAVNGVPDALEDDYLWLDRQLGLDLNIDFAFITEDNTTINLDVFQMQALFKAGAKYKLSLTQYARILKDQLQAADTIVDLDEIDIVSGWPA